MPIVFCENLVKIYKTDETEVLALLFCFFKYQC